MKICLYLTTIAIHIENNVNLQIFENPQDVDIKICSQNTVEILNHNCLKTLLARQNGSLLKPDRRQIISLPLDPVV